MMRVFIFSDIHTDTYRAKEMIDLNADIYILAGDVSDLRYGLKEMGETFSVLKEKLWIMAGNNELETDIRAMCKKYGFTFFHDQLIEKGGYSFFGLGYSNKTPFGTPGERSEEEIRKVLKKVKGRKKLILASHAPPEGSALDLTRSGKHAGCMALREFILSQEPIAVICGHIHENEGKIGILGRSVLFAAGKKGVMFDL